MVAGYDPKTGEEIWRASYAGYSGASRPVYSHGLLIVSSSFGGDTELLAVRASGKGNVTKTHIVWKQRKDAPNTPSALLDGNEVYSLTDGGTAVCLDVKTGKVHWSERLGKGFSASPMVADGKVYLVDEAGTCFVVKAGSQYELLAKNEIKKTQASLAVVDGAIYLRTDKHLYCIKKG